MTAKEINDFLESRYTKAMDLASGKGEITSDIDTNVKTLLDVVIKNSEPRTGVYTVLFTSIAYKCLNPQQDIRLHQEQLEGGYSGRTFDFKYITPFLRSKKFPSMKESGWLTRSLEHAAPYSLDYNGKITPKELKAAFLRIIDMVETKKVKAEDVLLYLLQALILQRDAHAVSLAIPQNLSINNVMELLIAHFKYKYTAKGASRLPVLALYAVYQCMTKEMKRYDGKTLLEIESHTSADARSGRMGDIDIVDEKGNAFEAVEVKFDIPISHEIVQTTKAKILSSRIERYYILSTKEIVKEDKEKIDADVQQLKNTHGCTLVVNGVIPSLKYYLRLITDLTQFVENYTQLLASDQSIAFEHRNVWNTLVGELN